MKRKKFLPILLALTVLFSLTGCGAAGNSEAKENTEGTASADGEQTVIKLAVQKSIYLPYLAEDLGYLEEEFKDDNVTVELVQFSLGPEVIEAIGSNQVDIGFVGDLPAFSGLVNGGEYTIIGKYAVETERGLFVRNDAGISQLSDLKGKKIGVPLGSNLQPLIDPILADGGLTQSDVEILNLSHADIVTSIGNGDIDAAITCEPYISQADKAAENGVTLLAKSTDYYRTINPILARNEFAEANADYVSRILSVFEKTATWKDENVDEAISRAAAATEMEEESVRLTFETQDIHPALSQEDIQAWVDASDRCYEQGLITAELDVSQFIDTSYLEAAGLQ
jgi:aliphatic sulfonates family ABC transporter substrate-binding protein